MISGFELTSDLMTNSRLITPVNKERSHGQRDLWSRGFAWRIGGPSLLENSKQHFERWVESFLPIERIRNLPANGVENTIRQIQRRVVPLAARDTKRPE